MPVRSAQALQQQVNWCNIAYEHIEIDIERLFENLCPDNDKKGRSHAILDSCLGTQLIPQALLSCKTIYIHEPGMIQYNCILSEASRKHPLCRLCATYRIADDAHAASILEELLQCLCKSLDIVSDKLGTNGDTASRCWNFSPLLF